MSRLASDINAVIPTAATIADLEEGLKYYPALAMLNTKYIVFDGNSLPLTYNRRLGNAWFVQKSTTASSADAEMAALGQIDPAVEAVVFDASAADGTVTEYTSADSGNIVLTHYSPNRISYDVSAVSKGLAVFSEIWYPAGWKAFIDGQEAPILRADYTLRALLITRESMRWNLSTLQAPSPQAGTFPLYPP